MFQFVLTMTHQTHLADDDAVVLPLFMEVLLLGTLSTVASSSPSTTLGNSGSGSSLTE